MWWDGLDCGREPRMGCPVNGPVFNLRTRRIIPKEVVAVPVFGWPDWSWNEAAPTVGAHIFQHSIYTRSAKRTFVGTNARFERIRRQHLVAILTGRPKFGHTDSFAVTANDDWGPKKFLLTKYSVGSPNNPTEL